jgi:hypothetical protein
MPQRNGMRSQRGRSAVARKAIFGGASPTNGMMPNVLVKLDDGQLSSYINSNIDEINSQADALVDPTGIPAPLLLTQTQKIAIYFSNVYYKSGVGGFPSFDSNIQDNPYYNSNISKLSQFFYGNKIVPNVYNLPRTPTFGNFFPGIVNSDNCNIKMGYWKLNYIERQTRYFGGPKKGGSAPRATGFMIAPSSSQAFQAGASAQRPNYLFKFRQNYSISNSGRSGGPSL